MGLTGLSTCSAVMTDPFGVGGGRRLPGSSKNGPGKESSRNEVRLPVRHDPPKLGKRGEAKVNSKLSWSASAGCGPPLQTSSSWVPGGPLGLLRAFPGQGQPGALDSCPAAFCPHAFAVGIARLTPGLTSLLCRVLQGCRWPGVGR